MQLVKFLGRSFRTSFSKFLQSFLEDVLLGKVCPLHCCFPINLSDHASRNHCISLIVLNFLDPVITFIHDHVVALLQLRRIHGLQVAHGLVVVDRVVDRGDALGRVAVGAQDLARGLGVGEPSVDPAGEPALPAFTQSRGCRDLQT